MVGGTKVSMYKKSLRMLFRRAGSREDLAGDEASKVDGDTL